jgi:hypothetical protein
MTHPRIRPNNLHLSTAKPSQSLSNEELPVAAQMEYARWFRGFRTVANKKEMVQAIANTISRYQLQKWVASLRFEKQAQGEFYFFIGFDRLEFGQVPEEIEETLLQLRYFTNPIEDYYFDQLQNIATGDLEVQRYGQRLRLPSLRMAALEDPFDQSDDTQNSIDDTHTERWDKLMLWLSALGKGSWETFQRGCQQLQIISKPRQVLRTLRLLGHIETFPDGTRWSINPITLEGNTEKGYLLLGRRSDEVLNLLAQYGEVIIKPMEKSPSQVHWRPADPNSTLPINNLVYTNAINTWTEHLPSIEEWQDYLEILPNMDLSRFEARIYDGQNFIPVLRVEESGLYQLFMLNVQTKFPRATLYYDQSKKCLYRADWYGLRFLTLYTREVLHPVKYDSKKLQLAVLLDQRFPEFYERLLVLSSGKLPKLQNDWLIYSDISPSLMATITKKLHLKVERKNHE